MPAIPSHISASLRRPELRPRRGNHRPIFATVRVPEAPVDEDRELAPGVDDIGLPRQIGAMKPM